MRVLQRKRFDPKQMCHRQSRGTTGSVCVDRGTWLWFPTKWIREAFSPFVFIELALYMSCLIAGARWWSFPIILTYFYIYLLVMLIFFSIPTYITDGRAPLLSQPLWFPLEKQLLPEREVGVRHMLEGLRGWMKGGRNADRQVVWGGCSEYLSICCTNL